MEIFKIVYKRYDNLLIGEGLLVKIGQMHSSIAYHFEYKRRCCGKFETHVEYAQKMPEIINTREEPLCIICSAEYIRVMEENC